MMGEFQINNLPLIIISIAIIVLGVLGYLEFKKLFVKLNMISTKLDEMTENREPQKVMMPGHMGPPPHIQQQMMMRRKQDEMKMKLMQEQGNIKHGPGPGPGPGQSNLMQGKNNSNNGEIFMDEVKIDENKEDSIHDSIHDSIDDSIDDSVDDITENDEEINSNLDDDDNQSIMTIELDNKFKHLSIKELKDLCKENNLPISGNKSTLASRLFENDENDIEKDDNDIDNDENDIENI